MTKNINRPDVTEALVSKFGLQGRVRVALDEIIQPVIVVGDLGTSPVVPVGAAVSYLAPLNPDPGEFVDVVIVVPAGYRMELHTVDMWMLADDVINFQIGGLPGGALPATEEERNYWSAEIADDLGAPKCQVYTGSSAVAMSDIHGFLYGDGAFSSQIANVRANLPPRTVLGRRNAVTYLWLQAGTVDNDLRKGNIFWSEYPVT